MKDRVQQMEDLIRTTKLHGTGAAKIVVRGGVVFEGKLGSTLSLENGVVTLYTEEGDATIDLEEIAVVVALNVETAARLPAVKAATAS